MNIPKDKIYHFIAGALIAILGGVIIDPMTGLGFAAAAGIGKECYDDWHDKKIEIWDAVATWIGGACGFTVVSLINYWR